MCAGSRAALTRICKQSEKLPCPSAAPPYEIEIVPVHGRLEMCARLDDNHKALSMDFPAFECWTAFAGVIASRHAQSWAAFRI